MNQISQFPAWVFSGGRRLDGECAGSQNPVSPRVPSPGAAAGIYQNCAAKPASASPAPAAPLPPRDARHPGSAPRMRGVMAFRKHDA